MRLPISLTAGLLLATAGQAAGQSLFVRAAQPAVNEAGEIDRNVLLRRQSLFFVQPPEPRTIQKHDLVTIIIDEITRATSSQSLETNNDLQIQDTLNALLDPAQLAEARLRPGNQTNLQLLNLNAQHEFTGEGDYDRTDRITSRLTAKVIDVKPNGTLVLEATKRVTTDDEERVAILSGVIRQDDITNANTVLSSQMADLRFEIKHEGEIRKAAQKGLVTRVLETLFGI